MTTSRWTIEQCKLAFHLYCQLPFGQLHRGNKDIIELAKLIGRTPSAVAMKLGNFASLDPAIINTGRTGLGNAGSIDKQVWSEFHADWEKLAEECDKLKCRLGANTKSFDEANSQQEPEDYAGETRPITSEQRIKQGFFRRAVLSSYRGRCCMSGLTESRLLIASHIVPWSEDRVNRLNPRNGLCLSAIHDKAFDCGLITLTDDYKIIVSNQLLRCNDKFIKEVIISLHGSSIEMPERFIPNNEFIAWHRNEKFKK